MDIQVFRSLAGQATHRDAATVRLGQDAKAVQATGSGLGRLIQHVRVSENRALSEKFADSLRRSYGREIADRATSAAGLKSTLDRGKPLRLRQVRSAIDHAETLSRNYREANREVAANFTRPVAAGSDLTQTTLLYDKLARRLLGPAWSPEQARALVDLDEAGARIEATLIGRGRDGASFVTSGEAAEVAERMLTSRLILGLVAKHREQFAAAAFGHPAPPEARRPESPQPGLQRELFGIWNEKAADIGLPGSRIDLSRSPARALWDERIAAAGLRGEDAERARALFDNSPLSAEVRDELASAFAGRAERAVAQRRSLLAQDAPDGKDAGIALPPDEFDAMTERVLKPFVEERFDAMRAALPLQSESPAARALLGDVLSHGVPPDLVAQACRASDESAPALAALGAGGQSAQQFHADLVHWSDRMTGLMRDADFDGPDERNNIGLALSRLMLKSLSDEQVAGLVAQFQDPDSSLRATLDGADYMAKVFTTTPEFHSDPDRYRQLDEQTGTYRGPIETAANTGFNLSMLAMAAYERAGAAFEGFPVPQSGGELSDGAVLQLRNLGVPVPSPDRLGRSGQDVPLSAGAMAGMQRGFDEMSDSPPAAEGGVSRQFRADANRAAFRIGDDTLSKDPDAATRQLADYCRDESGRVNEGMLLALSRFANQETWAVVLGGFAQPDFEAPFAGMPVVDQSEGATLQYRFDRSESNEVTLSARFAGPMLALTLQGPEPVQQMLDSERSRFDMRIDLRFDPETWRPELSAAEVSYAMQPAEAD